MPTLSRKNAKPLLRTVKNKQHATDADHEEIKLPTPPPSSWKEMTDMKSSGQTATQEFEDYTQDPLSSDDEAMQPKTTQEEKTSHLTLLKIDRKALNNRSTSIGQENMSSNREEDDDDDSIFGVRYQPYARSAGFSSQDKTAKFRQPTKRAVTYGSQGSRPQKKAKPEPTFKRSATPAAMKPIKKRSVVFQTAREASIFRNIDEEDLPKSPSLSSLSSAPDSSQDISFIGEQSTARTPLAKCDMCQEDVDLLLKQDFTDLYGDSNGKLNLLRQKAFCRHHRQHTGRSIWKERGYPNIAWSQLDKRMYPHHDRLRAIIQRKQSSFFRDRFAETIESSELQTNEKLYEAGVDLDSSNTGYYGPKGQEAMVKNITAHLHEELNEAALHDPLIGSKGIQGGITGFIQSVLIPEVAVHLIMEDLELDEHQARDMLEESRDLGSIVNIEEKTTDRIEDDELEEDP